MAGFDVPRGEQGTTRVFSLSMGAMEARQLRDNPQVQEMALGLDALNPGGVEIFALDDLGEIGLAGYLRDGVDAQEVDLQRDRAKLSALEGWVMLVHSSAFEGAPVTLEPANALTLIGTYAQTPATAPVIDLQAEAAQPFSGAAPDTPAASGRTRGGSLVIAVLALICLGVLIWAVF
ncbi:MAG: hypothetical protein AB8B60_09185 [Sulfitobacter sp.]